MFPTLRHRLGHALDLVVEFSTLGEYGLGATPAPAHSGARQRRAVAGADMALRMGGAGQAAGGAQRRRIVAGGATGRVPAATPAARRLGGRPAPPIRVQQGKRSRAGQPPAGQQPCLSAR